MSFARVSKKSLLDPITLFIAMAAFLAPLGCGDSGAIPPEKNEISLLGGAATGRTDGTLTFQVEHAVTTTRQIFAQLLDPTLPSGQHNVFGETSKLVFGTGTAELVLTVTGNPGSGNQYVLTVQLRDGTTVLTTATQNVTLEAADPSIIATFDTDLRSNGFGGVNAISVDNEGPCGASDTEAEAIHRESGGVNNSGFAEFNYDVRDNSDPDCGDFAAFGMPTANNQTRDLGAFEGIRFSVMSNADSAGKDFVVTLRDQDCPSEGLINRSEAIVTAPSTPGEWVQKAVLFPSFEAQTNGCPNSTDGFRQVLSLSFVVNRVGETGILSFDEVFLVPVGELLAESNGSLPVLSNFDRDNVNNAFGGTNGVSLDNEGSCGSSNTSASATHELTGGVDNSPHVRFNYSVDRNSNIDCGNFAAFGMASPPPRVTRDLSAYKGVRYYVKSEVSSRRQSFIVSIRDHECASPSAINRSEATRIAPDSDQWVQQTILFSEFTAQARACPDPDDDFREALSLSFVITEVGASGALLFDKVEFIPDDE